MAVEHRTFVGVLRQSYPDDCRRGDSLRDARPFELRHWGDPTGYRSPDDRRAAIAASLMNDYAWERLDDADRAEITKLAAQEEPLVDLYNYVDYRMSQTVVWNPTTDQTVRYGVEMSWSPLTENGVPEQGSAEYKAAYKRVGDRIAAVDQRAWQRAQTTGPQVPPGTAQSGATTAAPGSTHNPRTRDPGARDGR